MAEKDTTERRVYNLPADLLERLRAFQDAQGIASETEAARRLLDSALQMRDSVFSLLGKLEARFHDEKDLRLLNRDVLAVHPLIIRIHIEDEMLTFDMKNGTAGRISSSGKLEFQSSEDFGREYWSDYNSYLAKQIKPSAKATPKKPASSTWDAKPDVDLDDEIPF